MSYTPMSSNATRNSQHRLLITDYLSRLTPRWDSALVFLSFLALYIFTLSPDILPADSGEFQVVVPLLGVAHPPGFALYTLLGRVFIALIPIGTPAHRPNLFSAFLGALTLVVVNRAVSRLLTLPDTPQKHPLNPFHPLTESSSPHLHVSCLAPHLPGLLAAFILGVSTTFWSQATTANIRSLTALLTPLLVYALVEYRLRPTPNRLALFALTLSAAVVHHLSLAFIGVLFAGAIFWFVPLKTTTDGTASRATDNEKKHPLNPFHPLSKTESLKIVLAALA